jgi:hypothetical protein
MIGIGAAPARFLLARRRVIGVDIRKEIFHLVELGVDGKIAFGRRSGRQLDTAFNRVPCRHSAIKRT